MAELGLVPAAGSSASPIGEQNLAAFKVILDGLDLGEPETDLSGMIGPRLISLSITEKRGGDADQLDLVLHDHDGQMELPREGATLRVSLGWKKGKDVTPGMVDKGSFKVDEVEYSGSPDLITIRARSADFSSAYRVRRERSHRNTTIGALVRKVAGENKLQAHISPELASIAVPVLAQDQKSDMAMIRQLGRRHDAVATVKAGRLIFSRIGSGATATGLTIPVGTIKRGDGDAFTYKRVERSQYAGTEARWHDKDKAKRKTVRVAAGAGAQDHGSKRRGDRKTKRLKRVYHSEAAARHAAQAANGRTARRAAEFEFTLALGRPDLYPERSLRVSGFKPEIDGQAWLIAEVTHTLDENGLGTKLKLETA